MHCTMIATIKLIDISLAHTVALRERQRETLERGVRAGAGERWAKGDMRDICHNNIHYIQIKLAFSSHFSL